MYFRSIRGQILFSFLILALIPVTILGILGPLFYNSAVEDIAAKDKFLLVDRINRAVDLHIREMERITLLLLSDPEVSQFFDSPFHELNISLINKRLSWLKEAYPEIRGILLTNRFNRSQGLGLAQRTREALTNESWYILAQTHPERIHLIPKPMGRNLICQGYSGDDVVCFTAAVNRGAENEPLGVVLIDWAISALNQEFPLPEPWQNGIFFITDMSGHIVYAPVNPYVYRIPNSWIAPYSTTPGLHHIKGQDFMVLSIHSDLTGWTVVGLVPLKVLLAEVDTLRLFSFVIVIFCFFMALGLSIWFTHRFTKPIFALQGLMKDVESGNLEARYRPHREADELVQLGKGFNTMVGELQNLLHQVSEEQRLKKEAEIRILQEQIKPHFLYNTLDTIHWMAAEYGAQEVVQIVHALTHLFRTGLNHGQKMIQVSLEVELVKSYLLIQKARYEDKFTYEIEVEPQAEEWLVIKFTLQPLVENALYHGIKNREGPGKLKIRIEVFEGNLRILVEDDGAGIEDARRQELNRLLDLGTSVHEKAGYGLFNINEHIRLKYGLPFGIKILEPQNSWTRIQVLYPLIRKECDA